MDYEKVDKPTQDEIEAEEFDRETNWLISEARKIPFEIRLKEYLTK